MHIEPNTIYVRNATGHQVVVVSVDVTHVSFYKLHMQTRERIGSKESLRKTKFLVRYA